MLLAALAQSAVDDASSLLNGPLGVGAFLVIMFRMMVTVMGDRAKVCESDRSRCYTSLETKDEIQRGLTEEIRQLNADGRRSDEDVRRYLDERFADVKTAVVDIQAELQRGRS